MLSYVDAAVRWAGTTSIAPSIVCQATFTLLGAGIVALTLLPKATRKHLLDYGPRDAKTQADANRKPEPQHEPDLLERCVIAALTWLQVPHAWFISFYAFYLIASVFWAVQWWMWKASVSTQETAKSNLFGRIVAAQEKAATAATPQPSMTLVQVYVCFGLEFLQASRRLYEHLYVMKPSSSKMNAAHFLLGLAYYAVMSVAVWVEGSQAIIAAGKRGASLTVTIETLAKLAVGVPLFIAAWFSQYWCHRHLASLVKYSLPEKGLFRYLTSPHYTSEFALYFALSIVAAPEGRVINRTFLSSELFVLAGLGVTAARTKQWYSDKFGAERVAGKWIMIPFVF